MSTLFVKNGQIYLSYRNTGGSHSRINLGITVDKSPRQDLNFKFPDLALGLQKEVDKLIGAGKFRFAIVDGKVFEYPPRETPDKWKAGGARTSGLDSGGVASAGGAAIERSELGERGERFFEQEALLTIDEISQILSVGKDFARQLLDDGELDFMWNGCQRRVPRWVLREWERKKIEQTKKEFEDRINAIIQPRT